MRKKRKSNNPAGRTKILKQGVYRHIYIERADADLLKRVGGGSLSHGIAHAARVVRLDEERLDLLMPE